MGAGGLTADQRTCGRDAHQARGVQVVGLAHSFNKCVQIAGDDPGFLRFFARVHLHEYFRLAPGCIYGFDQGFGQFFAVQGFDHIKQCTGVYGLVGLQRPDKAQLNLLPGVSKLFSPSGLSLLYPVFTEHVLPGGQNGRDLLIRLLFGYGGQANIFRAAT